MSSLVTIFKRLVNYPYLLVWGGGFNDDFDREGMGAMRSGVGLGCFPAGVWIGSGRREWGQRGQSNEFSCFCIKWESDNTAYRVSVHKLASVESFPAIFDRNIPTTL